jgi:hypothetical protein
VIARPQADAVEVFKLAHGLTRLCPCELTEGEYGRFVRLRTEGCPVAREWGRQATERQRQLYR